MTLSNSNHLPFKYFQIPSHCGVRISTYKFEGNTVQSLAKFNKKKIVFNTLCASPLGYLPQNNLYIYIKKCTHMSTPYYAHFFESFFLTFHCGVIQIYTVQGFHKSSPNFSHHSSLHHHGAFVTTKKVTLVHY